MESANLGTLVILPSGPDLGTPVIKIAYKTTYVRPSAPPPPALFIRPNVPEKSNFAKNLSPHPLFNSEKSYDASSY